MIGVGADRVDLASQLTDAGLPDGSATRAADRFLDLLRTLAATGTKGAFAWWVPGRVELLGKHTDYAGGESLVAAVDRGFCFVAAPATDGRTRITDAGRGETETLGCTEQRPAHDWSVYARTVHDRLAADWHDESQARPMHVAFASDLPPAAGLSSSTALMTGLTLSTAGCLELDRRADWRRLLPDPVALASYLGAIESGGTYGGLAGAAGVGTEGGAQDSTAILCSAAGEATRFRYAPTERLGSMPLPAETTLVIAQSGVRAEKTGAARDDYNRASRLARTAAVAVSNALAPDGAPAPHLGALVAAHGPNAVREAIAGADPALVARVDQFLAESTAHVPAACDALRRGDLTDFATATAGSVRDARRWLGNQIPETNSLTDDALRLGAVAASPFGAGYGGSVWALVPHRDAASFAARWRAAFADTWPGPAAASDFFPVALGPPVVELR